MSMILTDYQGANLFDELVDASGKIRPYYRNVADKLTGLGNEELSQKLLTPADVKKNKLAEARSEVLSEFFRSKGAVTPSKVRPAREGL